MPEISRFEGMIIYMQNMDVKQHHKPHIHVYYGNDEISVGIDGELLAGRLPIKKWRILSGWIALHEDELYDAWNKAVVGDHFDKIPPIR